MKPALPVLKRLVHSDDEQVLSDACWAFSNLSDGSDENIQSVIEAGVVPRLVELLQLVLLQYKSLTPFADKFGY